MSEGRDAGRLAAASSAREAGNAAGALAQLRVLLERAPGWTDALVETGLALAALNQHEAALASLLEAVRGAPEDVQALYQLGIQQRRMGDKPAAYASFGRVLELQPAFANAWYRRGNLLVENGALAEALAHYDQAIACEDDYAVFHYNRGVVLKKLGQSSAAIAAYDRAIALNPGHADAQFNRANALWEINRTEEAVAGFRVALALKPAFHCASVIERGTELALAGLLEEATSAFELAVELSPANPAVLSQVSWSYAQAGLLEKALHYIEQAIALDPSTGGYLANRAGIYRDLGQPVQALEDALKAVEMAPGQAEGYATLGATHGDLGQFEAARAAYQRAIALKPDLSTAHFNLALLQLQAGELEAGLRNYEWRWLEPRAKLRERGFSQRRWLGDFDLAGSTLLICPEQGLGDFIQCVRYLPWLKEQGARVLLETPPAMVRLMATLAGVDEIVPWGEVLPAFDCYCPIMSLPLACRSTLDALPDNSPYLAAAPEQREAWKARLGPRTRPRIGLVWSGSTGHRGDHRRSLGLAALAPLLRLDAEFHCLQKEIRAQDESALAQSPVLRHEDDLGDFADTAGLIEAMDLVISVDTSVAHLAGALGKPVWVLLPTVPDWRWLLGRDDSPWYRSARLFRQATTGDWDGVVADVMQALASSQGLLDRR